MLLVFWRGTTSGCTVCWGFAGAGLVGCVDWCCPAAPDDGRGGTADVGTDWAFAEVESWDVAAREP